LAADRNEHVDAVRIVLVLLSSDQVLGAGEQIVDGEWLPGRGRIRE
jgi:hypothetical protein